MTEATPSNRVEETRDLMRASLRAGELDRTSEALIEHAIQYPADRAALFYRLGAKVPDGYFAHHQGRTVAAIERWRAATPDWVNQIEQSIIDPARFVVVVQAMDRAIEAEEE